MMSHGINKTGNTMKLEMHAHTSESSPCAQISAREVVKAYSRTDYDGIVITDHFDNDLLKDFGSTDRQRIERYLLGYDKAYDTGMECGFTVILGIEIRLEPYAEDYLWDRPGFSVCTSQSVFSVPKGAVCIMP